LHEPTDGDVQAGDRAPDAPLQYADGTKIRLFDIFRGPHFTMMALGGAPLPTLDDRVSGNVKACRVVPPGKQSANGDLIDVEGYAHRHFGSAIIVVRPDKYLGFASSAPDAAAAAARYLSRFFS
jgi:hypothetical protein